MRQHAWAALLAACGWLLVGAPPGYRALVRYSNGTVRSREVRVSDTPLGEMFWD